MAACRDTFGDAIHNAVDVGNMLLAHQLIFVIEDLIAQEGEVPTGGGLHDDHQEFTRYRARD